MIIIVSIRTIAINLLADSAMPVFGDQQTINKLNELRETSLAIRNILLLSMFINILIYIPMQKLDNLSDDNLKFTIGSLTFLLLSLLLMSLITNGSINILTNTAMPSAIPEPQFTIDRIIDLKGYSRSLKISLLASVFVNIKLYNIIKKIDN